MRRSHGERFIELAPQQYLSIVTIKLAARRDIFNVVEMIDKQKISCSDMFFAYELIDIRVLASFDILLDEQYVYQLVMAFCPSQWLQRLLIQIPRSSFIKKQEVQISEFYRRLSNTSFRAYNKLMFRRLKLSHSGMLMGAKNIFTRMCYCQNVFSLSNLGQEVKFLAQIRNNPTRIVRGYKFKSNRVINEQQKIQYHLIGTYREEVQIYLPPQERERLQQIFNPQRQVEEVEMKDCQQRMDIQMDTSSCEQEYLLKLSQDLKRKEQIEIRRDIKLELSQHEQYETDRYRSRSKSR